MRNGLINMLTNTKVSVLLIVIVVILSYWQMLFLNIWQDDNALLFKVKHFTEAAGVFGPGAAGVGAYRYIALPFIPIENFFGSNLIAYYSLCLMFYILAALSVYFLGRVFFKSGPVATFTALIFAAGFVGLEGVTRLFNSIQTSYSIALVCLTFALLYIFYEKGLFWSYLLAIPLFYFTIETGYVRTQYLILPVAVLFILSAFYKRIIIEKLKNILLLFPFVFIYFYKYLYSPDPRSSSVKELLLNLFSGKWDYLHGLFGSVGNIFLNPYFSDLLFSSIQKIRGNPYHQLFFMEAGFIFIIALILFKTRKSFLLLFVSMFWLFLQRPIFQKSEMITIFNTKNHLQSLFSTFLGGEVIFILLFHFFTLKNRNKKFLGLFCLSWVVGNVLAYSFYLPLNPLETTNRYLTHSLAPLSLLVGLIFLFNKQRKNSTNVLPKKNILIIILFIFWGILSTNKFLYDFRKNVSIPTENFYTQLKKYVSSFGKGAIFYFDIDNDSVANKQFRDFFSVGSMPDSTAIALRYGMDRYDLFLTESFNEMRQKISEEKTKINNVYTFFYKRNTLINTTNMVREGMETGYEQEITPEQQKSISQPKLEISSRGTSTIMPALYCDNLSFPSIFPFRVMIEGYLYRADLSMVNFPLSDLSRGSAVESFLLEDIISGIKIFQQLSDFRSTVKVADLPSERLATVGNLIDGDENTYWRYSRGLWDKNRGVSVVFNLGSVKQVNQVRWINIFSNSTPTFYNFEASEDGKVWTIIKEVQGNKMDKKEIIEKLKTIKAQYIRFTIKETFDHDSPVIAEISIFNSDNDYLTEQEISTINYSPYRYISNFSQLNRLRPILESSPIIIPISWETDKNEAVSKNTKNIFIGNNGYFKKEIIVPEGGTHLKRIWIGPSSIPSVLKITKIQFKTL